MQFNVGTSGYSYAGWKGSFYPLKLPQKEMLSFYAQRFSTVESNSTFYKLPDVKTVESWIAQVPGIFQFAQQCRQVYAQGRRD